MNQAFVKTCFNFKPVQCLVYLELNSETYYLTAINGDVVLWGTNWEKALSFQSKDNADMTSQKVFLIDAFTHRFVKN